MREWFNRLEKQTEFSNSKVCAHHYIGFLRRGREKYIEVGGEQLSFCYTDPCFKSLCKGVMGLICFQRPQRAVSRCFWNIWL